MQDQRPAIGSLPDTLGFDHGCTSTEAGLEQQMCWNDMQSSAHNMLPSCITSPSEPGGSYRNSTSQGGLNLTGWSLGELSSSRAQNHVGHDERKAEHGQSPPIVACGIADSTRQERQYEPANTRSLDNVSVNCRDIRIGNAPLLEQNSGNAILQDLNISAGFVGHASDLRLDSSGTLAASSSFDAFGMPSSSGEYLNEQNEGRPGSSSGGRRVSCKRKALEGNARQSSVIGSSSYFQQAESSDWHAVPGRYNAGRGFSGSIPSENVLGAGPSELMNPRLGVGAVGGASGGAVAINLAGNAERSRRNYRVRASPSHHQAFVPIDVFSNGSNVGHSNISLQQSSGLLPVNNDLDTMSPLTFDNTSSQRQPTVVHAPALRRTLHSSRWNGSSVERAAVLHEGSNSTSTPRSMSEHPMFIPPALERRNSARSSTNWSLTEGDIGIAGNIASASRTSSSSGVHQFSAPHRLHRNPSQYPRRLSEFVRRSLLSSAGSESGNQSSSNSPVAADPSLQEGTFPLAAGIQGRHLAHSRSGILLERQLDDALGIPYSLRTLATAGEGRSRLVSEQIRNVLNLMRRGEGLRIEDVMILDQSVLFGIADVHDRHRDMRLDVDNMSYEELLALEERIGNVSTGLSEKAILDLLKQRKYFSIAMGAQLEVEPCCVCQEEYSDGQDIGTLDCGHEFHTDCIKQWLMNKNLCPICKTTALNK